ncbi:cyclic nucleotide-binding-like protein [Polychytrium aggregatum]|uniref:cyclic nucleotide-binding-like protein n=1 Tax=Polychytrium aggregatum TaxID=110093 RepID=UPI0022FED6FA|nr:cyclic nucleotide-binding-like protein [Polychytrium aggregatum]KAI9203024.1 cyclic nucleotide-binding-like protein [Polychytrium aggregatum]
MVTCTRHSVVQATVLLLVPLFAAMERLYYYVAPASTAYGLLFLADLAIRTMLLPSERNDNAPVVSPAMRFVKKSFNFCLDIVAIIPFDQFLPNPQPLLLLKFFACRNFYYKLKKSPLFAAFLNYLDEKFEFSQGHFMFAFLTTFLLLVLHWEACALWLLGRYNNYADWVDASVVLQERVLAQYIWTFQMAIANTFQMSYKSTDTVQQCIFISFVVFASLLYASIIATLFSFVGFDGSARLYRQKMDTVNEYLRYKQVPEVLRQRVRDFYYVKYKGKYFDEVGLLSELNVPIIRDIALWNCSDLISKVDFLSRHENDGRDNLFSWQIAMALVPCYFVKDEDIFIAGEEGDSMYFIETGECEVIVNGVSVTRLKEGSFFGELSLISGGRRTATVRAAKHCVLYRLAKDDFNEILIEYEDVRRRIQLIYQDRLKRSEKQERRIRILGVPKQNSLSRSVATGGG